MRSKAQICFRQDRILAVTNSIYFIFGGSQTEIKPEEIKVFEV